MASEGKKNHSLNGTPDELWKQVLDEVNKESRRRKSTSHEDGARDLELLAKILEVVKLQKDVTVDSFNRIRETFEADSDKADAIGAVSPDALNDIRQAIQSLSDQKKDNGQSEQLQQLADGISDLAKRIIELGASKDQHTELAEPQAPPIDSDSITQPLLDAIGKLETKLESKDAASDLDDIRQAIQSLSDHQKDNGQVKQLKRVADEIAVLGERIDELSAVSNDQPAAPPPAAIDADSITQPLLDAIGKLETKLESKDAAIDLDDIRQTIQSLAVGKKGSDQAKQLKCVADGIAALTKQVGELSAASNDEPPPPIDPDSIIKPLLDAIGKLEAKTPAPNTRDNGTGYRQGQKAIEAQLERLQEAIDNRADADAHADRMAAMNETLQLILDQAKSSADQTEPNIRAIEKKLDQLFGSIAKLNEASTNGLGKKLDRFIDAVGDMAAGQGNQQINEQIQSLHRQLNELEASGGAQNPLPLAHDQPLVMRGYRRHRKQSRWGYVAIVCAPLAIVWGIFWYLMGHADPMLVSTEKADNAESKWLSGGCLVLGFLGVGLSLIGIIDRRTRYHAALLGLVLNLIFLLVFWILKLGH